MKICLIAPTHLPARRANTIQVMKMAQAIKVVGHEVLVLVPQTDANMSRPSWDELAHHYGLQHKFGVEWRKGSSSLRRYDYGLFAVLRARRWGADLIYTRLPQAAALASMLGIKTIFEIHDLPQGVQGPRLLRRFLRGAGARRLVVITKALGADLPFMDEAREFITIAPDGVDLVRFADLPEPAQARQQLSFADQFTVGYTGHLYPGRGADLILQIAERLPEMNFLLVGGETPDIERIRKQTQTLGLNNIILAGFVPNMELPVYQAACDVLLMPYQPRVEASSGGDIARYLSPMKLFEYLACGRAIVSSDLPVLREILNSENSILLPPDEIDAWVSTLQNLYSNGTLREGLAKQALQDVKQYSWEARAQNIFDGLDEI